MLARGDVLEIMQDERDRGQGDEAEVDQAPKDFGFIDTVLTEFIVFWKAVRHVFRELIYTTILPEFDFKRLFAIKFAQVLQVIVG